MNKQISARDLQSSKIVALCFCFLMLEGNFFIVRRLFGLPTVELESWILATAALTVVAGIFFITELYFKKRLSS